MRPKFGVDYSIRGAYPFEGPVIGDLYQGTVAAELDWERPLDASWVIAVHPSKPEYYAALSLVASQPIGRLEMLRIRDGISKRLRACVVRDIVHYSLRVLKRCGCQAVMGSSEVEINETFGRCIQRRWHGVKTGDFTAYLARI